MSREKARHTMYDFEDRNTALTKFADQLATGKIIDTSLVRRAERLIFRSRLDSAIPGICAVCEIATARESLKLCQGHWDYVVIDDSDWRPYLVFEDYVQNICRTELLFLSVRHFRGHYMGVLKGGYRCQICGDVSGIVEELINAQEESVKRHSVCIEHATFRPFSIDNSRAM